MEFSNGLSDAEIERLALLSEEMAEAQQAIGKILRHGFESYNPFKPETTNREDLEKELGHVLSALNMMSNNGDLNKNIIDDHRCAKMLSIHKWLHHQKIY